MLFACFLSETLTVTSSGILETKVPMASADALYLLTVTVMVQGHDQGQSLAQDPGLVLVLHLDQGQALVQGQVLARDQDRDLDPDHPGEVVQGQSHRPQGKTCIKLLRVHANLLFILESLSDYVIFILNYIY